MKRTKNSPIPQHGSAEHLAALGALGVASAAWIPTDDGPVLQSVVFFSPELMSAKSLRENLAAPAPETSNVTAPGGLWEETVEMRRLRSRAENAKSADEKSFYQAQYEKLAREQIMYHSG